jgi:hypothetical protein
MRIVIVSMLLSFFLVGTAAAVEVAGVNLEPAVTVNNNSLKLNGFGVRKKLFVKVYIGALYSVKHFSVANEALNDTGDKLIRMNFLHSKVDKEKIIDAFKEGFANNSPDLAATAEAKKFLALFTTDFLKGDIVDLILKADGSVAASHNGKQLGTVASPKLARGVLAIYLGDKPADEDLKKGMLGK